MSRLRANWHIDEAETGEAVDIEAMGLEIDLREPPDAIHEKIRSSLRREGRLFDHGIQCDLKDNGQSCYTCPEFVGPEKAFGALCGLGRHQEDLVRIAERLSKREDVADGIAEAIELAEMAA